VLDAPLTHLLGPMFFQQYAGDFVQAAAEVAADSPFRFPFARYAERLKQQPETVAGLREVLVGPPFMDTIRIKWRLFAPKAAYSERETTANCIYAVKAGTGRVECDGTQFRFERGDVFVIPAWRRVEWQVKDESYLLRVSDENLLEKLNWLKTTEPGSEMEHAGNWPRATF